MPGIPDDPSIPLEFEHLPEDVVAIEKTQRETLLAERNKKDAERAELIATYQAERAFEARPVGDTTAGKLNPL